MKPAADDDGKPRERLQPALLDRLTDKPEAAQVQNAAGTLTSAQFRASVLRDLAWLLNATQPHPQWTATRPAIAASVLNYGLPPLAGRQVSRLEPDRVIKMIRAAIVHFEPRILERTLTVRAVEANGVMDTHNVVEFDITGELWAQPAPLEIQLRTRLDLEAGQVEVRDTLTGLTSGPSGQR